MSVEKHLNKCYEAKVIFKNNDKIIVYFCQFARWSIIDFVPRSFDYSNFLSEHVCVVIYLFCPPLNELSVKAAFKLTEVLSYFYFSIVYMRLHTD